MSDGIVFLCAGLFLALVGVFVGRSKYDWMIAGINTMTATDKARWNIKEIKRFVMWLLIVAGLLMALAGVFLLTDWLAAGLVVAVCIPVFLVLILGGVVYVNISKRFRAARRK